MANSRINLNLLICLHYILKEQSVSLAAKRMFVSQSAMSKSLAQLREHLNDPIIVRNKGRIEITATAKGMQQQVEHIVSSAINFFENTTFSPKKSQKKFSVLCDEVTMQLFSPSLIKKITASAPLISVSLIPTFSEALNQLASGSIDLALLFSQEDNTQLYTHTLLNDELLVVMNKQHPLADQPLTLDNFTLYPFVTLTPEHKEYAQTTQWLNTQFSREIIAQLPSVNMIFDMLSQNPYIAVLPKMALSLMDKPEQFVRKPLPMNQENRVPLNLLWATNHDSSSPNQWLRSLIIQHFSNYDEAVC